MDLSIVLMLFAAGLLGGGANAIAGGGTFFTFPALIASGLDPLVANASNAVAIYPGHAAAVPAYRAELRASGRALTGRCLVVGVGGLAGALLLLGTGRALFEGLVPWLLLFATVLFACAGRLQSLARGLHDRPARGLLVEFVFAVYGGYFGAGLGILLMAALTIVGVRDMQMANAQKNLLATLVTTLSVVTFSAAGIVAWPQTLAVLAGALAGGYFGARTARHIPARALRTVVVLTGLGLSVFYFAA